MKTRNIIGTAVLAVAFMLAASPALASVEIGYSNDFQKSLDKFLPGSSLDSCVTKETLKLNYEEMTSKTEMPPKYNGYAELTRACEYPVWMMTSLTGSGNNLLIEFDARVVAGCAGCIPLVYAGTTAPKNISQFKADYKGLGDTWQRHTVKVSLAPPVTAGGEKQAGGAVIAIAFTNLDDCPIHEQRIGIDNLRVTLDSGTPPPINN